MGNKVACAGRQYDVSAGYHDSPYSKQISPNMIRFWAEVYLLAQDGTQPSTSTCRRHGPKVNTKWQMVVPKLVPVNIVRVQDSPATVTHVTAYNTKIDKVMDVIISFPGIDLYRGSDCFVYWCDNQNGLTWGLNFISGDDATYFIDLVVGLKCPLCEEDYYLIVSKMTGRTRAVQPRRAHSVVGTHRHNRSVPGSPDASSYGSGLQRRVVKFADQHSHAHRHGHSHSTHRLHETGTSPLSTCSQQHDSRHSTPTKPVDPTQLYLTGQKLSDWSVTLPPDSEQLSDPAQSEAEPTAGVGGCTNSLDDYVDKITTPSQTIESPKQTANTREQIVLNRPTELQQLVGQIEQLDATSSSGALKSAVSDTLVYATPTSEQLHHAEILHAQTQHQLMQTLLQQSQSLTSETSPSTQQQLALAGADVWQTSTTTTSTIDSKNSDNMKTQSAPSGELQMSLDSQTLRRLLDPLPVKHTRASTAAEIILQQKGQVYTTKIEIPPRPRVIPEGLVPSAHPVRQAAPGGSSSSLSSVDNSKATSEPLMRHLEQSARRAGGMPLSKGLSRMKRSSLHLVAGANGNIRAVPNPNPVLEPQSGSSLSSSYDSTAMGKVLTNHNHQGSQCVTPMSDQTQTPGGGTTPTGAQPQQQQQAHLHKTRKTGFLLLKRWLERSSAQSGQFVVVQSEPWHQFWARLKGSALYLYKVTPGNSADDVTSDGSAPSSSKQGFTSQTPSMLVDLSRCLVQPMPEYPRRSNVFCVSTCAGTAYLLQVTSEFELDAWSTAIHSAAAYEFTRVTGGRDAAIRMLKRELDKLDKRIDSVTKMLCIQHMPNVSAVSAHQVAGWEHELEMLHTNHFTFRCYLAALKSQDEPSCKRALGAACAETKKYLSQLGVFTMSAVHAYLMSRIDPTTIAAVGTSTSTFDDPLAAGGTSKTTTNRHSKQTRSETSPDDNNGEVREFQVESKGAGGPRHVDVHLPTGQVSVISVQSQDTVAVALSKACAKIGLVPRRHFLSFRAKDQSDNSEPKDGQVLDDDQNMDDVIDSLPMIDLCDRACYHIHLRTDEKDREPLGLTVRTQRIQQDLVAYVAAVEKNGPADRAGVHKGDELIAVNLRSVRSLPSPLHVEQLLQRQDTLCLVLRSKRHDVGLALEKLAFTTSTDSLHLNCQQPPAGPSGSSGGHNRQSSESTNRTGGTDLDEPWLSDQTGGQQHKHKVKYRNFGRISAVNRIKQRYSLPPRPAAKRNSQASTSSCEGVQPSAINGTATNGVDAPKTSKTENGGTGTNLLAQSSSSSGSSQSSLAPNANGEESKTQTNGVANNNNNNNGKMSASERLEKIIFELVETEKAYIECLERLVSQYLIPLKKSALFPEAESDRLLHTTQSIIRFQKSFFEELHEASGSDNVTNNSCNGGSKESSSTTHRSQSASPTPFTTPSHLRNALLRIGGVFLNGSNKFKVYSPFCAVHFRVQKILRQEERNETLQQFLSNCNHESQLSCSLESYLIKPVQRVLRYPLFLQQMKTLTNQGSPENLLVTEALSKMEKVAEYINEMQRVYEEYGQLFTHVQKQFQKELTEKKLSLELSELLMFGECDWLNANDSGEGQNGKSKNSNKNVIVESLCFVFKTMILVSPQLDRLKPNGKKKSNSSTDPFAGCRLIPVREIEVNGSDVGSTEKQFLWILIHMNASMRVERVYHFVNRRQDVKQQFLRAIRKAAQVTATRDQMLSTTSQQHQNGTNGVVDKSAGSDRVSISSPDSAVPHLCPVPMLDRSSSEPTKPVSATQNGECRPASHYSSQSDGGYVSNSELQKTQL